MWKAIAVVVGVLAAALVAVLALSLYAVRDDGTLADRTFGQEFLLQLADNVYGALATGLFVAGGAALAVWALQRRAETRREARELEHEYVRKASEIAGGLYFATQRHWRRLRNEEQWGAPDAGELEKAYDDFALRAEMLEQELSSRYGFESPPRVTWHQIRDLLTVRYYDLRNRPARAPDTLLMVNSIGYDEELHSGLTVDEFLDLKPQEAVMPATFHSGLEIDALGEPDKLLKTYRSALAQFHRDLAD